MEQALRRTLAGGVGLTIVPTDKFKTSVMRAALLLPLGGARASARAVLPLVLRRGTQGFPDMQALGGALDELYGARIEPMIRKVGDSLAIGFVSDVIDESYMPGGERLTARAAEMLCTFFKSPLLENGVFRKAYTDGEKENLAVRIEAQRNDPRTFAPRRLIEKMCAGEAFGQSELGTAEGARALTPQAVYEAYEDALRHASIELFYCGAMPPDAVEDAFRAAMFDFGDGERYHPTAQVVAQPQHELNTVVEEMNVRQGKLSIGLRSGVTGGDEEFPAMALMNIAFGGSTSSKLFLQVRERMSLCYYASSSYYKHNGILTVASGIENKNFDVAREEILRQLHDLQQGGLSDEELHAARLSMCSGLRAMQDSPTELERFWLGQAASGLDWSPDGMLERFEQVTRDQVVAAAQRVRPDTVYFLKGVDEV